MPRLLQATPRWIRGDTGRGVSRGDLPPSPIGWHNSGDRGASPSMTQSQQVIVTESGFAVYWTRSHARPQGDGARRCEHKEG